VIAAVVIACGAHVSEAGRDLRPGQAPGARGAEPLAEQVSAGQDDRVLRPDDRRLRLLLVAIVLLVAVPSIARWQLAALGAGLIAIGVVLIVTQRRRRAGGE